MESNNKQALAVIEGLLFLVGDEGLTLENIAEAIDVKEEQCSIYLNELKIYYLSDDRGIELVNYGGLYKFVSKPMIHPYAKYIFNDHSKHNLSQAALETLAIIAYKQPITRIEIEEIRGVGCDMMLRKLLARDLIKEAGRSEAAGRPFLYEVTKHFMDCFKLIDLAELPELPDFADQTKNSLFD